MKLLLVFIASLVAFTLDARTFKVLVVTTGVRAKSSLISPLDVLSTGTIIQLGRSQYVALIDEFTNLYEFYGERTILLDTLQGSANIKIHLPEFSRIYLAKQPLARAVWNDKSDSIGIVFPYPFGVGFNCLPNSQLCLEWTPFSGGASREYVLELKTQFEERISVRNSKTLSDCIEVPTPLKKKTGILIAISESGNEKFKSSYKLITISNLKRNDVSQYRDSPIVNVVSGLYCESRALLEEAYTFYQRAFESAPTIKEYKEILDRFKLRNNIN